MQTHEIRPDYRPHRSSAPRASAEPAGRMSPWALFGVIAGAIVAGTVLLWIVGLIGIGAMVGGFTSQVEKQIGTSTSSSAVVRPAVTRPVVTQRVVTVPPKSVAECKAETGGVLNEHFARCRAGYQYVETTRR